jgi:hypothetical protein
MTDVASNTNLAWQAEVTWESRWVPMPEETPEGEMEETPENETGVNFLKVWDCFVEIVRPGCERIRFRVNHRKDRRLTFTDRRESLTGTAGTTGTWGTRPAQRADRTRALTPTAFKVEVARLIGAERAEEIVQALLAGFFLESPTTLVRHRASKPRVNHAHPADHTR